MRCIVIATHALETFLIDFNGWGEAFAIRVRLIILIEGLDTYACQICITRVVTDDDHQRGAAVAVSVRRSDRGQPSVRASSLR